MTAYNSATFCLAVLLVGLLSVADAQMVLTSGAFENLEKIPGKYCCDLVMRDDYRPSPPLSWSNAPAKTRSFVLMMDDMDNDEFVHWLVKDIPRDATSLEDNASELNMPVGSHELLNSNGYDSYSGPCPLNEEHRYRFRLFAMPATYTHIGKIGEPESLRAPQILEQIEEKALFTSVLTGRFYLGEYIPPPVNLTGNNTNATGLRGSVVNPRRQATVNTNSRVNGTRKVMAGRELPQRRFIKPSEVLKPKFIRDAGGVKEDPCVGVKPDDRSECVAALPALPRNATRHSALDNSTQALVTSRVESFEKSVDDWLCSEEDEERLGVVLRANTTQSCPLRAALSNSPCGPSFPREYVCDSPLSNTTSSEFGVSPAVSWRDAPARTQSFVVVIEESSAPPLVDDYGRVFWLVTDIPATTTSIVEGASGDELLMPPLSIQHRNTFGDKSYTPPCPQAHDLREYRVRVFAMPHATTKLFGSLPSGFRADDLTKQLQKQALCMATNEMPFSYRLASQQGEQVEHKEAVVLREEAKRQEKESAVEPSAIPGEMVVV